MKQLLQLLIAIVLVCGVCAFSSCGSDDVPPVPTTVAENVEPTQSTPTITTPATTPAVTDSVESPGTTETEKTVTTTSSLITEKVPDTDTDPVPDRPGSLPDPDSLPQADQSSVGKTVELSLKNERFYYYYDADSGKERLIVVDLLSTEEDGGILYIYETDLNGLHGLCKAIASPISGRVLAVSTISCYEYGYASWGGEFVKLVDQGLVHEEELISLTEPPANPNTAQCYFPIVNDDGEVVLLAGNMTAQNSEYLTVAFDVMDRIIARFDLAKYL